MRIEFWLLNLHIHAECYDNWFFVCFSVAEIWSWHIKLWQRLHNGEGPAHPTRQRTSQDNESKSLQWLLLHQHRGRTLRSEIPNPLGKSPGNVQPSIPGLQWWPSVILIEYMSLLFYCVLRTVVLCRICVRTYGNWGFCIRGHLKNWLMDKLYSITLMAWC